jgi:hypothetical protein
MSINNDSNRDTDSGFRLSRRAWLEVAAGAGLGLLGPKIANALDTTELRSKPRKNLRLGIMSTVYADLPLDEAARQIKAQFEKI